MGNILDISRIKIVYAYGLKAHYIISYHSTPYVSIICVNPAENRVAAKEKSIPELERGIGLSILRDLAEKYDGQMTAEPGEGRFETTLILNGAKPEA